MSPKPKVILARYMGPEAQKILDDDTTTEVLVFVKYAQSWLKPNVLTLAPGTME